MAFGFSVDQMDTAPLPSLGIGPTGQVDGQNDVVQKRRRFRTSYPKEIPWVVLGISVKCASNRASLFDVRRVISILNRFERIIVLNAPPLGRSQYLVVALFSNR